jgi:hypothetical protein
MSLAFFIFFLAFLLGPASPHGGPRNSRPVGCQLSVQKKGSYSFLVASEKVQGLRPTKILSSPKPFLAPLNFLLQLVPTLGFYVYPSFV